MKKKVVLGILLGCLMIAFVGCNQMEKSSVVEAEVETEETEVYAGPTLGSDNAEGYKGFTYLQEKYLMTEPGEEKKELTVYIPKEEEQDLSANYVHTDSMGVEFTVQLEPYVHFDLPEEDLDYYVTDRFNPFLTAEYKDLDITDAKEITAGVGATAEYCRYDQWTESYYSVFCTYYLTELENGKNVLVTVEITSSAVTEDTEKLVEELEQFYQFDINWDAGRAEKKSVICAENDTENVYTTGNFRFELPLGWKRDLSLYADGVYAPEGNAETAGCMISIDEEIISYNDKSNLDVLVGNITEESIEKTLETDISNYAAKICETALGKTVQIVYSISDADKNINVVMCVVGSEHYVYTLMALETPDAVESAQTALDMILKTGQSHY